MKKFLASLLAALFAFGLLTIAPRFAAPAAARAKLRPAKVIKKSLKKIIKKTVKKYRKAKLAKPIKSAKKVNAARKAALSAKEPAYQLPSRAGMVIKSFTLEEGVDDSGAETIVNELKSIGVDEASVDVNKNVLQAKFNSQELSAVSVIKKLKELGYTVKRID
jgi:hypothetical protein